MSWKGKKRLTGTQFAILIIACAASVAYLNYTESGEQGWYRIIQAALVLVVPVLIAAIYFARHRGIELPRIKKLFKLGGKKKVLTGIFLILIVPKLSLGLISYSGLYPFGISYVSNSLSLNMNPCIDPGMLTLGAREMWLSKGETLTLEYDLELKHGHVYLHIFKSPDISHPLNIHEIDTFKSMKLERSVKSEQKILIPESGFYEVKVSGWGTRERGCSFDMNISWHT